MSKDAKCGTNVFRKWIIAAVFQTARGTEMKQHISI